MRRLCLCAWGGGNRKISIQQDFNGSYGIYLYENGDYFALSNSFFRLLEYVKTKFPISLNRDYANHILTEGLVNSIAYMETPIQEIVVLDKDAFVEIDMQEKKLEIKLMDYKASSLWINSSEGIEVLDRWFFRWTKVFRKLKEKTDQITIELSGGFDTRIMFLLMLQSGINLKEIQVVSINDTLHTHKEDYEIASEIAGYYGFGLNNNILKSDVLPYSLEDILNIAFYTKMGFHKEMYFKHSRCEWKRYRIAGSGGETVRSYWEVSAREFKDKMCNAALQYSTEIRNDITKSINKLIDSSYKIIKNKHKITDDYSADYPKYMYREIRNRGHFGKASVEDFFSNTYDLMPYIDPDLLKLRLNDPECPDNNLLMAVIYVRYCPQLLDFKFEGERSIEPETIEYAKKINEKFSIVKSFEMNEMEREDNAFEINIQDEEVTRLKSVTTNSPVSQSVPEKYLKSVFDSMGLRKLFATYFDEEIYCQANGFFEKNDYHPMRHCYSVIAITKVIEDITAARANYSHTLMQSMDRFIRENYYESDYDKELILRLRNYLTARMDFKLLDMQSPDFKIVSSSDSRAEISMPEWLQEEGIGYMVESYAGSIDLSISIVTGGSLKIWLRGRNVSNGENGRIPYWIDYHSIQYNGKEVSCAERMAWHDKPICLNHSVEAGEVVNFHAEWTPYRGDYQYIIEVKKQKNKIGKMQKLIEKKEKEIDGIRKSHTFRAGDKVLYIPKKIKNWIER